MEVPVPPIQEKPGAKKRHDAGPGTANLGLLGLVILLKLSAGTGVLLDHRLATNQRQGLSDGPAGRR